MTLERSKAAREAPLQKGVLSDARSGTPLVDQSGGNQWTRKQPSVIQWLITAVKNAGKAESNHGLGFLFVPVAMGLGAGMYFTARNDPSVVMLLAGLLVSALLAGLVRSRHGIAALIPGLIVAMFVGALAAWMEAGRGPVLLDSDVTTEISGWVQAREFDAQGNVRYLIELTRTRDPEIRRPPSRVRLVARAAHEPARVGALITGRARLSSPSGPVLPGGYDFAFRAFVDGIGAHGFFYKAPQWVEKLRTDKGVLDGFELGLRELRERIAARIRSIVSGDPGGIAAALAVSDRRGITEPTVNALRATGLAHILAISGLHMALAAGTLYVGLRLVMAGFPALVEAFSIKKFAATGALVTATAYLVISGGSVSTQRAWVMLAIMLGAVLMDRPALTMRNVAIAAIVIILLSPSAVVGPGFQMSFAATAALIAAYATLSRWRDQTASVPGAAVHSSMVPVWLRALMTAILGLAITSLVAGLATGLFSAHHFHRLAGNGLLANMLAMPMVTLVVMPAGLMAMLLMPFGLDAPALHIMGFGLEGVIAIAHYVNELGGDIVVGRIAIAATATAGLGFIIVVFLRSWLRLCGLALIGLGAVLALPPLAPAEPDILISEDGRLVGLLVHGQLASNAARPSAFVFRQWWHALRRPEHLAPAAYNQATTNSAEPGRVLEPLYQAALAQVSRFHCAARGICVASHRGAIVMAIGKAELIGPACDRADLVIVAIPVYMKACRSGATLVTARSLRRTGSLEITILSGSDGAADGASITPDLAGSAPQASTVGNVVATSAQVPFAKAGSMNTMPAFRTVPVRATTSIQVRSARSRPQTPVVPVRRDACRNGADSHCCTKPLYSNELGRNKGSRCCVTCVSSSIDDGPDRKKDKWNQSNPRRPGFKFRSALAGVVRPWTIQRYYDWRSRSFNLPE